MRFIVIVLFLFATATAHAYVGPGLGIGVIVAILGALLAVILAIAGVIWYPIKRMLRKKNHAGAADNTDDANTRSK
jgi:hypothetical protein